MMHVALPVFGATAGAAEAANAVAITRRHSSAIGPSSPPIVRFGYIQAEAKG